MLFNSVPFLIFFPIVVVIYFILPDKIKNIYLLIASYFFYMCWNAKYGLLIAFSTIVTYAVGLLIEKAEKKRKKQLVLILGIIVNISILFFFKYFEWFIDNINQITGENYQLPFSIVLPVGISFYTFQALGYVIDVYRGNVKAEKNIITYALFVSFFPQLVAGPIERSGHLLEQLKKNKKFNPENVVIGLRIMLLGYIEKVVIADNISIVVDTVYDNLSNYSGSVILVTSVLFAIQIYCDFGGYSHIAIGAARVLNIKLMDNFRQPYFSVRIKDFWNRWHISLSSWLRDYVYISLGGNRCSKIRKHFNIMVTFLVSGLWHGASWHYVLWGGINGLYQIIGDYTRVGINRIEKIMKISKENIVWRLAQICVTFVLVIFAWIMFRSNSLTDAAYAYSKIFTDFNIMSVFDLSGWRPKDYSKAQGILAIVGVVILLVVDVLREKGKKLQILIENMRIVPRWLIYYAGVLLIIVAEFQVYGKSAAAFIYFQF